MRVSLPTASAPAATGMLVMPPLRKMAVEVKPPPESVTEPAGVALPLPPLTATVTVSACAVVMLEAEGVTATVGVVFAGVVTTTVATPVELL